MVFYFVSVKQFLGSLLSELVVLIIFGKKICWLIECKVK